MDETAKREWKSGWSLVLSAMVGISVINVMVYSTGLIINPLEAEFGWSRAQITSGLLINSIVGVTLAPLIGRLIDQIGPRRIAIPGLILFCFAFGLLAAANGTALQWWFLWVLVAFGSLMLKPTVWTTAVASRFDRARGVALAATLCGTGLTGLVAPLIGGLILDAYGWRMMIVGLSLIWGIVALPLVFLFFFGASDIRRRQLKSGQDPVAEPTGVNALEGLLTFKYLRLALAVLMIMLVISGTLVHIVPFFIGAGLDPVTAASMASIVGASTMIGRLGTGVLLDRFSGTVVGGISFSIPVILMIGLLNFDGSIEMALGLAALLGLSAGAELDIAAYMTSRHFGMRNYGFLFGVIVGLMSLAMGVGPLVIGMIYDHFGSYSVAFQWAIPMSLIACLLIVSLGRYDSRFVVGKASA